MAKTIHGSEQVIVGNEWHESPEGPIVRVFVNGLWYYDEDHGSNLDDTDNWFGLNVEEAKAVYLGLGAMLAELEVEAAIM